MHSSTSSSEANRRFAVRGAGFSLLTLALLVGLELGLRQAVVDHTDLRYEEMFSGRPPARDLVLGPSSSMALDPRPLTDIGLDAYNFSFAGAGPDYMRRWYGLFRDAYGRPDVAILAVDWFLFKPGYMKRTLDHEASRMPPWTIAKLMLDRETHVETLLTNALACVQRRDLVKDALFLQGHLPQRPRYHRGFASFETHPYRKTWVPQGLDDPQLEQSFTSLVDQLQRDGARVVFLQMPHYLPEAGERPAEYARIARLANTRGIPYLNYNADRRSAINQDPDAFLDWAHLNEPAGSRFSVRLRDDLERLGIQR